MEKSYSPPLILEESQYIVKENRMTKFISNGLEVSSDESDEEVSDEK